eukprot:TRINITY_DN74933_c0_g1_i1.p1 TRINITY_DN74933_c0_g1~~TRINITY_DN74933_c0_g1_i1.p1  ORF type:complete len:296 (+),score=70.76 TRINITY_DN74933_c0_g1_i1:27-890(+)
MADGNFHIGTEEGGDFPMNWGCLLTYGVKSCGIDQYLNGVLTIMFTIPSALILAFMFIGLFKFFPVGFKLVDASATKWWALSFFHTIFANLYGIAVIARDVHGWATPENCRSVNQVVIIAFGLATASNASFAAGYSVRNWDVAKQKLGRIVVAVLSVALIISCFLAASVTVGELTDERPIFGNPPGGWVAGRCWPNFGVYLTVSGVLAELLWLASCFMSPREGVLQCTLGLGSLLILFQTNPASAFVMVSFVVGTFVQLRSLWSAWKFVDGHGYDEAINGGTATNLE